MKNTDQVKAGKELSGESIESPRPAPHNFQSMHGTGSCWHCDKHMLNPIHTNKEDRLNEAISNSNSGLAASK